MNSNPRLDRIQRLLDELEYELVRGFSQREIQPDFHMTKLLPCFDSPVKLAKLDIHISPVSRHDAWFSHVDSNLRLVKNETT